MPELNKTAFQTYVAQLLQQHKGMRVLNFEYQQQSFWLKQPERLRGVWRILKPHPQQAFQEEISSLQYLAKQGAPVPELILFGEDFLVLSDVGKTLNYWVAQPLSNDEKRQRLQNGLQALIGLHQKNLVHGRPALRDIAWQQGQVHFMDFESHSHRPDLRWQKMRDILVFMHSMYREKDKIEDETIAQVIQYYAEHGEPEIWQAILQFMHKYRWLYYLLLPFKPVAKTDLIAILKLFNRLLNYSSPQP